MEAIVGFEGQNDENELIGDVMFSKLKKLDLAFLPNLISFYAGKEKTQTTTGSSSARPQPLFSYKVILPVLEELDVSGLDSIEEIWDKQSPSLNEKTVPFSQLREMSVDWCEKLMNLVPSNILPRMRNLQKLRATGCPNVEFVVFKNGKEEEEEEEAADDSTLIIPQLRYIGMVDMARLKSFYSSCTTSNAQSFFNHQVAFPALENIYLQKVPMITELWVQQPLSKSEKEVDSFCKLKSIDLWECHQLEYVLPSYMLPQLHNLRRLEVRDCNELEVIVSNKLKKKEATNNDILVFPQLETLRLWNLDNLKCFCTGTDQLLFSHKVAFPALENIYLQKVPMITELWVQQPLLKSEKEVDSFCKLKSIDLWECHQLEYVLPSYMLPQLHNLLELDIRGCNEMEVIVSNKLKKKEATNNDILVFPQLKTLKLDHLDNLKCFCTGTDQLLFSHKVAFPALEDLTIMNVPKIKEIWDKQPLPEPENEAKSCCKLRLVNVQHCNQLVYVFPSYMLPQLQNLQKLMITNCKEMEVIISNKLKKKEATNNDIILFAELETVILQFLPNLKSLCSETQLIFSNIKEVFPGLEINTIKVARKNRYWAPWETKSYIDPDLMFLANGTSRKEEYGTSSKDEGNNDHNKEEEEDNYGYSSTEDEEEDSYGYSSSEDEDYDYSSNEDEDSFGYSSKEGEEDEEEDVEYDDEWEEKKEEEDVKDHDEGGGGVSESGSSSKMETTMTVIKKKKMTWRRMSRMPKTKKKKMTWRRMSRMTKTTKEEDEKRTRMKRKEEEETEDHISNLD